MNFNIFSNFFNYNQIDYDMREIKYFMNHDSYKDINDIILDYNNDLYEYKKIKNNAKIVKILYFILTF